MQTISNSQNTTFPKRQPPAESVWLSDGSEAAAENITTHLRSKFQPYLTRNCFYQLKQNISNNSNSNNPTEQVA